MLYTIHFHPALLTLKVKVSWRGWEMQSETLELDEAIRLEKMTADDQPMILETGRKEGSRRVYALERAREYTLEYSVSLFGRLGERDFLFIDPSSVLVPHVQARGLQEVVLFVPQSYSAQSSLKRESLTREGGVKRYSFSGEGDWSLAIARYVELPFLSGMILLLEETSPVLAIRALEEAVDLIAKRFGRGDGLVTFLASLPDSMQGFSSAGGVFVEKRAFDYLEHLPLLLERFFDVSRLPESPEGEEDFLRNLIMEYLVSESLQQVLSASQLASCGVEPQTLLRKTREFLGADAFDKLLQLILSKYEGAVLSKADFVREFDELSWKPGTGDFLRECIGIEE